MAETHVISGLVAKRSELAGLMQDYQKKVDQIRVAVVHLDASIRLFSPDYNLQDIKPKAHRQRNSHFKPGECQRMVLDIFRQAKGGALTSRQIGEQLALRKGLDVTPNAIAQLQKTVIAIVNRLLVSGALEEADKDGTSRTWRLA